MYLTHILLLYGFWEGWSGNIGPGKFIISISLWDKLRRWKNRNNRNKKMRCFYAVGRWTGILSRATSKGQGDSISIPPVYGTVSLEEG